ncbi:MAG: hypothetical protein NTV22_14290 [bacterium]|nr:hypothetical protein [bacterium]
MQTYIKSVVLMSSISLLTACDFGRVQTISVLDVQDSTTGSPGKNVATSVALKNIRDICADYASRKGYIEHNGYQEGDYIVTCKWWRRRAVGGTISINLRMAKENQVKIDVFEFPRGTFSEEASNVVCELIEELNAHNITNLAIGHVSSGSE